MKTQKTYSIFVHHRSSADSIFRHWMWRRETEKVVPVEKSIEPAKPKTIAEKLEEFEKEQPPTESIKDIEKWRDSFLEFYRNTGEVFSRDELQTRADAEKNRRASESLRLIKEYQHSLPEKTAKYFASGGPLIRETGKHCNYYNTATTEFVATTTELHLFEQNGWISRESLLATLLSISRRTSSISDGLVREDMEITAPQKLPNLPSKTFGLILDTGIAMVLTVCGQLAKIISQKTSLSMLV